MLIRVLDNDVLVGTSVLAAIYGGGSFAGFGGCFYEGIIFFCRI